jgi:drug/metabolite transporter (DMT)-like permease
VLLGLGSALIAACLYGVAAVLQAKGARRVSSPQGLDPRVMLGILRQPAAVMAVILMLFGFMLHLMAVRLVPLFLAQAGIAVSLVVSALLAVVLFGERLDRTEWGAVGAVFAGLVLLSASAGAVGTGRASTTLIVTLYACVLLIALVAAMVSRTRGAAGTAMLGLLAGCGYAIVGVSARILPGLAPMTLLRSPATYSLALGGSLAFFLYSMALQRGAVTLATTPMIVTQTVMPSVVGVLLLGDGVRPGWAVGAGVGFLVTVIAASVLVRFEGGTTPAPASPEPQPRAREADRS